MFRFYIEHGEDLIGASGHTTKQSEGIDRYLEIFGFASAESAAQRASDLGIEDSSIRYIKTA